MNKKILILAILSIGTLGEGYDTQAAPSIHSNGQLISTLNQFIEDYKASGASLHGDKQQDEQAKQKDEKQDLDRLFDKEMKQNLPAETLSSKIIELGNGGSFLKQKYKGFIDDLDLRDPNTYNQIVTELILHYYNDPSSRDAVYVLTQHLSQEYRGRRETGKLPEEDSVTQSILNWTMFASALIVVRDAVRERGGFLDTWNKYFRKIPETKLLPHHQSGTQPRPIEQYSPPKSAHREKCQNWVYGNKSAEELMQLRRILSRGKAALLGSMDSFCVSARIGTESFIKGGLVAGGAYAFADWEELKYDPAELLKPFVLFSIHNLMIETHQLYDKVHALFTNFAQSSAVGLNSKELQKISMQVAELKKQEQHFAVVAPELSLGKVRQPYLMKDLEKFRKRWKASIVLQGITAQERVAQVIEHSGRLQKELERYYESVEDEQDMISIAPIQIQREMIEKELAYLMSSPK
jgi:hypothetical protein